MSKKLKKVKGRREEKDHDHLCKQLLDEDGNVIVDFDKDVVDDWMDKEAAQRRIAKLQGV